MQCSLLYAMRVCMCMMVLLGNSKTKRQGLVCVHLFSICLSVLCEGKFSCMLGAVTPSASGPTTYRLAHVSMPFVLHVVSTSNGSSARCSEGALSSFSTKLPRTFLGSEK